MENCIVNENINNDFLSQSYSQGIERITGTKDNTFNFQIPKQLLEVREKTWDNLFDRYSKEEMSDDIELNVDTLEPEEEDEEEEEEEDEDEEEEEEEEKEKENAVSDEEYSCGQRVPMRKPATLVQYWINTGNPPYKVLSDENKLSETGSSLSESVCLVSNTVDADDGRKHDNDSSCSSVDTAAYILSNANVTKKADTVAIIEGAKCVEVKSLKGASIKEAGGCLSNNEIESTEPIRRDRTAHADNVEVDVDVDVDGDSDGDGDGDGDVDVDVDVDGDGDGDGDGDVDGNVDGNDVSDSDVHARSATEYMASEMYNGASVNVIQSNISSQDSPCEKANEADESSTTQRNLNVQTIDDIASIFRQFDKTSKRLVGNDRNNDVSDRDKMVQVDTFPQSEKQASENEIHRANDTSLTAFHRKKLYTGRDSPVDLTLTEKHDKSRLSEARQNLLTETKHPALDPDGAIKKTCTFLVRKGKTKLSLFAKKSIGSGGKVKRNERKEKEPSSSEAILDINDDKSQNSNIDSSCKSSSDLHDTSARRRDDHSFQRSNDTNISFVKSANGKQNVASLNLEPRVLLERIKPSYERSKKNNVGSSTDHARQKKKDIPIDKRLNKLKKLYSCEIENLEVNEETTKDSDESTILICQCNTTASQRASTLSDYSLDLRLDPEDDSSASNAGRKLSSPKMSGMNQKELRIAEGFDPRLLTRYCTTAATNSSPKNNTICQNVLSNKSKYSHLYGRNEKANVKIREIKVVLERLPARFAAKTCISTTIKMQGLNKTNVISQKEISSNESEAQTYRRSNVYGANKKANVKLGQLKVVVERLPANVCLEKISNVINTNVSSNNRKTLQNTSLQTNHERKSQAGKSRRIQACENGAAVRPVRNTYSLRKNTKSKETDAKTDATSDIVAESGSKSIFDHADSTFQRKTFRRKYRSVVSQDNYHNDSKYSVLTFTSDEDDFVRSIQHPRKRSKVSTDANRVGGVVPSRAEKNFCDQTKLVHSHDKNEDCSSRGSSTSIHRSSRKTVERDIESTEEKKKRSGVVEMKSFDSMQTTTDSLRIRKNEKCVFFSSEADNDSAAAHSDKRGIRRSFLNSKKNKITNDRRNHSNGVMKENGINRKDVHVMFVQTKTFDTNSSDSEESNSYTSPTCKVLRGRSSILCNNKLQYHHRANPEEIFNESIAKRYSKRHLKSLDSSLEKRNNRMRNVQMRSRSRDEEAMAHERLANEESNKFDIKSRIDATRKNASSTSPLSNVRNIRKTRHVQEKMLSNTFLEENNLDRSLPENKVISDKSKNSLVILQDETYVTSTVRKLLTFQTKSYYDSSDSSETL